MAVEFEEPTYVRNVGTAGVSPQGKQGALTKFFINKGFAKDKKEADKIMLGVAILFFALSLAVIIF